ncbi:MAG: serine/threonine protein kinase, partial [Proteobacteria bacterium]|nr:serine/threonine protein kinase [Pseudomonadota bacterium]
MTPRRLANRFLLDGPLLGEGETGRVLAGVDLESQSAVAIKLLHPHVVEDEDAYRRLQSEAGTAARLSHRNVMRVHGLWSDDGEWFLVSERVDGAPLESIEGSLAPEAVVALGCQLTEALVETHRLGLVHGDVRPAKVLLASRGAVLFGFGLAGSGARTIGCPGQTAPEVQRGAPPGVPADLYGVGVVLHRALTG